MLTTGLAWLVVLLSVACFELWASKTQHPTLSQWVWRTDRRYPWFRWFAFILFLALGWHLFLSGG